MQSRNKREGYYFGKGCDIIMDEDGWGTFTKKRRHKRMKKFSASLKGFFKGIKR